MRNQPKLPTGSNPLPGLHEFRVRVVIPFSQLPIGRRFKSLTHECPAIKADEQRAMLLLPGAKTSIVPMLPNDPTEED